jgi:hypothetical protein
MSKVVREFPIVDDPNVVVIFMHRRLGCVLTPDGKVFEGGEEQVHVVCENREQAQFYARPIVAQNADMIAGIHNSKGQIIEWIR